MCFRRGLAICLEISQPFNHLKDTEYAVGHIFHSTSSFSLYFKLQMLKAYVGCLGFFVLTVQKAALSP